MDFTVDFKELEDRAWRIINLARRMDEAFGSGEKLPELTKSQYTHLTLAIMAGLRDASQKESEDK